MYYPFKSMVGCFDSKVRPAFGGSPLKFLVAAVSGTGRRWVVLGFLVLLENDLAPLACKCLFAFNIMAMDFFFIGVVTNSLVCDDSADEVGEKHVVEFFKV